MLQMVRVANPQLRMDWYFPVRGHSFLPADRVFGRIEQEIRKKDCILLPAEYDEILSHHGTVLKYKEDWSVSQYREAANTNWSAGRGGLKISDCRVIRIANEKVHAKETFSGNFIGYKVLKKGRTWERIAVAPAGDISCVKEEKKTDVRALLKTLNPDETVFAFYEQCFERPCEG